MQRSCLGLKLAVLDANGANVASATVTGGHLRILKKDATNLKVQVIASKNICQGLILRKIEV